MTSGSILIFIILLVLSIKGVVSSFKSISEIKSKNKRIFAYISIGIIFIIFINLGILAAIFF